MAAKRTLDLVVVSGLDISSRMQECVFFPHSSSKFWIGRVNVSVPCYHSGYAYTTCGTPEYFAPEMAGIPRNPGLTLSISILSILTFTQNLVQIGKTLSEFPGYAHGAYSCGAALRINSSGVFVWVMSSRDTSGVRLFQYILIPLARMARALE